MIRAYYNDFKRFYFFVDTKLYGFFPTFLFFREVLTMTNITHRQKFEKMNTIFWEKLKVDNKGRVLVPKAIRQKLGLNHNSKLLWIEVKQKPGKNNEYIIKLGVDNK